MLLKEDRLQETWLPPKEGSPPPPQSKRCVLLLHQTYSPETLRGLLAHIESVRNHDTVATYSRLELSNLDASIIVQGLGNNTVDDFVHLLSSVMATLNLSKECFQQVNESFAAHFVRVCAWHGKLEKLLETISLVFIVQLLQEVNMVPEMRTANTGRHNSMLPAVLHHCEKARVPTTKSEIIEIVAGAFA